MKPNISHLFAPTFCILAVAFTSVAQAFDSGSDGSDGALVIAADTETTLTLPPDGIFNFTTVTINEGATLKFIRNAANTPVYMLATGDIILEGTIDIAGQGTTNSAGGQGGPGGYDGGNAVFESIPAGHGEGPGGGSPGIHHDPWVNPDPDLSTLVGHGNYLGPKERAKSGDGYGNTLLMPLIGGSGGGGDTDPAEVDEGLGGGGGGGAILIASNTRITGMGGVIDARGGGETYGGGMGSGGAIRLVSPVVEFAEGRGYTHFQVGRYDSVYAAGRVRIDTLGLIRNSFNANPSPALSIGANLRVFPPNNPSVRISRIGSQSIPVNPTTPTTFLLPPGSPENIEIEVEAENFNQQLAVKVVLTPENGARVEDVITIDNSAETGSNPAVATSQLAFPVGVETRVDVWTVNQ